MPIYIGEKEIGTKLVQLLTNTELEDDTEGEFMNDFQDEFLFELFSVLMIGGKFNQWDSNVESYKEVLKSVYKNVAK